MLRDDLGERMKWSAWSLGGIWKEAESKYKLFSDNRSVCGDLTTEGAFTFKEGLDEFLF